MSKTYYDSLPEDYQKIIDEGWEVGLKRCYEFLEENEAVVESNLILNAQRFKITEKHKQD